MTEPTPFSERLRTAITAAGLSQAKTAALVKVSLSSIQNWLKGSSKPSPQKQGAVLRKLAEMAAGHVEPVPAEPPENWEDDVGVCVGRNDDGCGYQGGKSGDTCPNCGGKVLSPRDIRIADKGAADWERRDPTGEQLASVTEAMKTIDAPIGTRFLDGETHKEMIKTETGWVEVNAQTETFTDPELPGADQSLSDRPLRYEVTDPEPPPVSPSEEACQEKPADWVEWTP